MKNESVECDGFSRRGLIWKKARQSKDGSVKNDKNREAIEKMVWQVIVIKYSHFRILFT